ncbi:Blood coagulation inhibitor Disintegrin, partial [Penicillium cf. griseofulvum]
APSLRFRSLFQGAFSSRHPTIKSHGHLCISLGFMAALVRNDRRIILHLDYDCFYASVFESERPELRSLPLAVQQKQIVVTCNYEARRRGLHKLQLIKDAKRICPDVVIVLGEDLTKFRNASKELYLLVRSFVWGDRIEKLGFDELFLDVTEMIDYNAGVLNQNDLVNSYFHLDRKDPTVGFSYDATRFHGSTFPAMEAAFVAQKASSSLEMRLLVASHLQGHIRSKLEHQIGFTATGGISTSKLLAKLVGNVHKPNGQTTLLPPYTTEDGISNVFQFLDDHEIRKIPGIGSRIAQKLKSHMTAQESVDEKITVKDVRQFPGMGPPLLDRILGGPGSVKGIGMRMWSILHGVDNSEVLEGRDVPTQISIEDSYGRLDTLESVRRELVVLSRSLIRRVRTDLLDMSDDTAPQGRWRAHPRTLRLSTQPRPSDLGTGRAYNSNRISRSAPLPPFIFNLDENLDALAERLVRENVFSMFRKLHPEKGWNLRVLNVAVTNMVETAGDQKKNSGRDIEKMFRQQETVLKHWTVQEESDAPSPQMSQSDDGWDDDEPLGIICPISRSQASEAIRQVTPVDNPIIRTPSHQIDHLSDFDITFALHKDGKRIKLELKPNHDILADDAYVQYVGIDGTITHAEPIKRHEHKVFQGRALVGSGKGRWTPVGWARITVKRDGLEPLFEGAFSVNDDKHHIELQSTYLDKKRPIDADVEPRNGESMIVYRDSDMISYTRHSELKKRSLSLSEGSDGCGADRLGYNADLSSSIFSYDMDEADGRWGVASLNSMFGLSKRQSSDIGGVAGNTGGVNLKTTIGDSSGCPKTKKVALIGIATDCEFTESFMATNSTAKEAAKDWIINVVNTASNLYEESFNVSIGLRNLTISETGCTSTGSAATPWNVDCNGGNVTWRLNEFSKWRSTHSDDNAYWTLMTNCPTGSEVGVSWMGRLCSSELVTSGANSVAGANVVVRNSGSSWQVFAHETGHTFGAVHDCDESGCASKLEASSQCCPLSSSTCDAGAKYIMNPYAQNTMTKFSDCTIGNICSAIGKNSIKSSCLSDNRGVVTITGSQCGNGIVEGDEECDCGGEESCSGNSCCDAKTCKFKDSAVCDDSNDSCCVQCQFASADTICRASTGECDIAETCSGTSSSCPENKYKDDGSSCGQKDQGLACASGQCTSRDYQCRTVIGSMLNTNDSWACENTDRPSCDLVCGAPSLPHTFGTTECYNMNQNYLDGTPCDAGGRCSAGQCKGSSALGWIRQHEKLVIGICVGGGTLILLSLVVCIYSRCKRSSQLRKARKAVPPGTYRRYNGPQPSARQPMDQWHGYPNGGYQNVPPPGPPPRYS